MKEVSFILLGMMMSFVFMGGASATLCYQETANATSACGGLATGSYNASDSFWAGQGYILYDGNWSSSLGPDGGAYLYINWSVPADACAAYVYWKISNGSYVNISVPDACFDVDGKIYLTYGFGTQEEDHGYFFCQGMSNNFYIDHTSEAMYDDGIWWDFPDYSLSCNSSTVYDRTCGGFNSQMVLTCENQSGYYDWSDDEIYCPDGCYQGACLAPVVTTIDFCTANRTMCEGSYVINCSLTSDGYYDWTDVNKTYCQHGCYDGSCVEPSPDCLYGGMMCSNGNTYNCTQNDAGTWVYTIDDTCTYGCEYYFIGSTVINTTCSSVGDAHQTSNALNMGVNALSFVFAPVIFAVFIFFSICVSLFVVIKAHSPEGGVWTFLLMLVLGTMIGPVPWYATALFAVLFLGFKAFGGLSHG